MDVKEEGLITGDIGAHWYYRAKLSALCSLIEDMEPKSALDVGAGLGFFAAALLKKTSLSSANCVDPGYTEERDEIVAGKPLLFRRRCNFSDADLVLMMDVIEHVADDIGIVAEYAAKVRPGTRFIISVPAFMWLWSGHDVFLEHHRRYTLADIEKVLRAGGLQVERGCYFYGGLLPLVAASRLGRRLLGRQDAAQSQMREHGRALNSIFWAVCRAELAVFKANRIAGLTAFVRAVKV